VNKPIYIVDGARTPFLKSRNRPGPFSASDLATAAGKSLLVRQPFAPDRLDEVILGCAAPSVDEVNIGRVAALRMGCGEKVPGWTVMRNCASGMQSIDSSIANMLSGRSHLVLAGGVDALSRTPLLYPEAMVLWFSRLAETKTAGQRIAQFARLPLKSLFAPVIGIMRGLTDPYVGLLMGQTAENVAYRFGISRGQMDEYAARSHQRVLRAQENGWLGEPHDGLPAEIVPLFGADGTLYQDDDGVRKDSTVENLAKLRPFFDRKYGNVTAGNSSQITDGAAWLVLATEEAVQRHDLAPIGRIVDSQWAGLDPAQMGLGPVHASTPILQRHGLKPNDLDAWEINEAFAAQLLGCLAAWKDDQYCREQLDLPGAMGDLDMEKLNVDGGAIALGHPVGASGARIVLHLLHVLKRTGGKRGMASICIGGGLGGAMLVETV
jgi:acetyl-CoA C-acetyltransferase